MTKQMIEVEGYVIVEDSIIKHFDNGDYVLIKVEKIQPRRIVLEETVQGKHERAFFDDNNMWTYWREVKESAIALNSDEAKLSLSVAEVKELTSQIWPKDIIYKINKFIKENS